MTATQTSNPLPNSYIDMFRAGLDANLPSAANTPNVANTTMFYFATDTKVLYVYDPAANVWNAAGGMAQAALAVGAALTAKAVNFRTYLLNTPGGSTLTLPAATGSGLILTGLVSVTLTSAAYKILTNPITDLLVGVATGATSGTKAALTFSAAAAGGFHSIQMPFAGTQPSGGFEGDQFDFTDIAAGKWAVQGTFQSGTTPTTPFSTATS